MNTQKHLVSLNCLALLIAFIIPVNGFTVNSNFRDMAYEFSVSSEAYKALKTWNINDGQAIPVSPNEIHRVAKAWIDKIKMPPRWYWVLEEISLVPINVEEHKWVWIVEFNYNIPGEGGTGPLYRMKVLVTLDGELIQPIITDSKH